MNPTDIETKMASGADIRRAQDDFAATFAAFKSANDERLAALESKSGADSLLGAKVDRINSALDLQSKHIDRLMIGNARPALGAADPLASEAKSAWSDYIRTGETSAIMALEGKSLTSTDGDGSYIAPADTESRIDAALAAASPFRSVATIRRVGGNMFKKPVSQGGAASGWAGETDARPETTAPALDLLEFPVGELYAMPAATQMLLDDGVADVDQWLADEVRDVFSAQETSAFITGNGVNKPRGILAYNVTPDANHQWNKLGYITTGTDGDFDANAPIDSLIDLIYAPKPHFRANASFMLNRRTLSALRKFKDADGNYIWQPASAAGQPSTLLGYSVTEVEDMPDIASSSYSIAFGDFARGYLIVDRQGVQVLRDPYSAKPYVLFYTTKRVGGGVQDFGAIKFLKFAQS